MRFVLLFLFFMRNPFKGLIIWLMMLISVISYLNYEDICLGLKTFKYVSIFRIFFFIGVELETSHQNDSTNNQFTLGFLTQ